MTDFNLQQERSLYTQSLEKALGDIIARLSQMPEVERVILFGSYAAGRRDLFTDLDLIIVIDTDQDYVQRTADMYQKLITGVDLDLLVYTPKEFESNQENTFLRHALKTGQVVYEKKRT